MLEDGIQIRRRYENSVIEQNIRMRPGSKRIDFETAVDWHEDHVLLKAAFPVDIRSDRAAYEIQFGHVERPTRANNSWEAAKFEVCGHKWADLSEGGYGVSLLNDCKYGYSIEDNVMKLSLLKSATYPKPGGGQGRQPVYVCALSAYRGFSDGRYGKGGLSSKYAACRHARLRRRAVCRRCIRSFPATGRMWRLKRLRKRRTAMR